MAVLVLLVAAWWTLVAPGAWSHNVLRSSDPADGATLDAAPEQLTLVFDDDVLPLGTAFQVTGPAGALELDPADVRRVQVAQPLPASLPAGPYSVVWRVTSADGHPIDGTLAFTVAQGPTAEQPTAAADPTAAGDAEGADAADPTAEDAAASGSEEAAAADEAGGGIPSWLVAGAILLAAAATWLLTHRRRSQRPASPGSTSR